MRSSSAILAFAVLAASPALSVPLKAFDVEARAISGAGAQDNVIEEAMQALYKSTPSTPPQAREIVEALRRELTDEEQQLVARVGEEAAAVVGDVAEEAPAMAGDVVKTTKKDWARLAAYFGGGAAAGGGLTEAANYWNWRRTVTPPEAREIVEALRRELTDEEQQLVARVGEEAAAVVGDVAEEAPAMAGDVVKTTKKDWARLAALFGGGAAAGGGLTEAANYWNWRRTVTPPEAREIVEALRRELTDEEQQLVARVGEEAAAVVGDVAEEAPAMAGDVVKTTKKDWARLAALFGGGAAAGGGLTEAANYWNWRRTVTPPEAREIVEALRRELTDEEQQLVARGAEEAAAVVAEEAPAMAGDVVKTAKNDWARVAALFGGGAAAGGGLAAFANYLNSLPTVTPPAQAREIVEALPAKRELIEAFLAARSLYDLD